VASIKGIDTPSKALAFKRTAGFLKAMKELDQHRDLVANASSTAHETDGEQSNGENDMDEDQVKWIE